MRKLLAVLFLLVLSLSGCHASLDNTSEDPWLPPDPASFPVITDRFVAASYDQDYIYTVVDGVTQVYFGAFYDKTPSTDLSELLANTPDGYAIVQGDALESAFPNRAELERQLQDERPGARVVAYYVGPNSFA